MLHTSVASADINFEQRCALIPDDNPPPHALFIQWGRFKAGAFGIPAVLALAVIAASFLIWRLHS